MISFVDLLTDEEKGTIVAGWMANTYRFRRGQITSLELQANTPFIQVPVGQPEKTPGLASLDVYATL
jgi:hypothetical protein